MRALVTTIAILLGLPGLAFAAPAPRPGWRDPYDAPKTAPRRGATSAPRRAATAAPRRAATDAPRLVATDAPRRAAAPPPPRTAGPLRRAVPAAAPTRPPAPRSGARADALPPTVDPSPGSPTLQARHRVQPPRLWHLRVTAASHNLLVRHASLNLFKADDLIAQGGLDAGLELTLARRLVVGVELGWVGGRFTDRVFETDTTELEAHSLRAGLRVGYRLWDSVTPYLRGGMAATWLAGRIRTDGQSLGGRSFAPGAYALAGVEFSIRRSWMRRAFGSPHFTMGVVFEAGWVHLGRFKLRGNTNTDGLVDDYRAGLGRLTLQGATVNAGLVLAF